VGIGALVGREWEALARGLEHAYLLLGLALVGLLGGFFTWKLTRRRRYGPASPSLEVFSVAPRTSNESLALRARETP
jgi:hypothetical protein